MRKLNYLLGILFLSIATWSSAQETAPIEWDGNAQTVTLKSGETKTFRYTAAEEGLLYIYSKSQNSLRVTLAGGLWMDDAYNEDALLQDTGDYDNGYGVYGSTKVMESYEIRFTLTAAVDVEDETATTSLVLQSAFFDANTWKSGFYWKGQNWENPVALTMNETVSIPVYDNTDTDSFEAYNKLTFCSFTAPSDGTVSLKATPYEILYLQEDLIGSEEFKACIESSSERNMHQFPVKAGKNYIVAIPNDHPDNVSVKMIADRAGATCADPTDIIPSQPSYDLQNGHNWFIMDVSDLGTAHILDLSCKEGWEGSISYWTNCLNKSDVLSGNTVAGTAATFHKNLDPNFTKNTEFLYIDVYMDSRGPVENGVTFTMREPNDGETCSTAIPANIGKNAIEGDARDYWFSYTPEEDGTLSLSSTSSILYYLPYCGSSNNADLEGNHQYRVYADKTVYIGIRKYDAEASELNIAVVPVTPGQNCDYPIDLELGQPVSIKEASRSDYLETVFFRLTPEQAGYVYVETTCEGWTENYWTLQMRPSCNGTVLPFDRTEFEDENTGALGLRYKFAVSADIPYILHLTYGQNGGKDIEFTVRYEEAEQGGTCESAIAITELGKDIAIAGEKDLTVWYTYTADKSGFYTIKGCARGNRQVKVGDCSAKVTTLASDGSYDNAYMRGYFSGRVYVEEGTPFFIYIKTNNEPLADEDPFFLNVTFQDVRPGEVFSNAIEAQAETPYALNNDSEAYEKWYSYTIPANSETTIKLTAATPTLYTMLTFYSDENTILKSYGTTPDYTDVQEKDGYTIVSRTYTFTVSDADRTIYIKTPVPVATVEGATWTIRGKGNAIDNVQANAKLTVTPNPNNGIFSVSVPAVEEGAYISIRNMAGAEVYKASLTRNVTNINLNGKLGAGMYLVTVNNGAAVTTKMIVK